MDPTTPLDHALFHLTPTRTRCDLLVVPHRSVGGASREKIASGLVQPFAVHLRAARDLIPKGGYSFTLRPPSVPAPWFTKGTLERFVRFVATPEILERVVTIEKEIVQIEESINREDLAATVSASSGTARKQADPAKTNEDIGKDDAAQGENSKVCLVRVLESRKVMLQKEQGMAYARASVAGFEKRNVDDLTMFADAFGADRLREACINFMELCKEKEQDKLWMEELAALEASRASQLSYVGASGIMLASEVNTDGSQEQNGSDDPTRAPMTNGTGSIPWNSGPYMYNFQNPGIPGSAPFPGYAFPYPGMQMIPPYSGYPENFHWSHRGEEKEDGSRSRSVRDKIHRSAETTRSSKDGYSDNESSNTGSEPDKHHVSSDVDSSKKSHQHKKSKKKSSRTVVIRNINYISSKGRHGEDDSSDKSSVEDDIDGDSLRRQVEDIVGVFGKHQNSSRHHSKNRSGKRISGDANSVTENDDIKVTDNEASEKVIKAGGGWDAFQNLLMRDDEHSDDIDQRNKDVLSKHASVEQIDVAGQYLMKNGEMVPPSAAKYQFHGELEKGTKLKAYTSDPLVESKTGAGFASHGNLEIFQDTERNGRSIKRSNDTGDDFLVSGRMDLDKDTRVILSSISEESSKFRGHRDGDWFLIPGSDGRFARDGSRDHMILEGEQLVRTEKSDAPKEKTRVDVSVDDSFIAPARVVPVEGQQFSLWEADVNIITGVTADSLNGNASHKPKEIKKTEFHEPEELQLILERRIEVEEVRASWTPEIEYTPGISHVATEEKKPVVEESNPVTENTPPNTKAVKTKNPAPPKNSPLGRSVTKNKLEALSRPKTIPTLNRKGSTLSKAEKEEAERKRIEELRMERERRIAKRSVTMGNATASKINTAEKRVTAGKSAATQPSKQHGFGYAAKFSEQQVIINKS